MMELNREQIVKALEWCSSGGNCMKCSEDERNPRLSKEGCMALQMRNALALIREQAEEIERLKELGTTKEIEKEFVRRDAKAETVKEMQERLKAKYRRPQSNEVYSISPFRLHECIDQIAKEMLEEE